MLKDFQVTHFFRRILNPNFINKNAIIGIKM